MTKTVDLQYNKYTCGLFCSVVKFIVGLKNTSHCRDKGVRPEKMRKTMFCLQVFT